MASTATTIVLGSPIPQLQHTPRLSHALSARHSSVLQSHPSHLLHSLSLLPKDIPIRRSPCRRLHCNVQESEPVATEEPQSSPENDLEATEQEKVWTAKKRLYAENLPLSLTEADIRSLFEQCGTVKKVELIKHKDGKSRGFSFITMSTPEEAFSAINNLDSMEMAGRIIRVSYAKTAKKPPSEKPAAVETRHQIYASNLAWKLRSSHLREFFMENSNPVSAKVVFDSPSGKSAGYGFISFATKEEAEAVVLALDGKELMGRPLRLKLSQNVPNPEDVGNKPDKVCESSKEKELES
ncbi:unnamed protein product [Victoria cruziana]